MSSRAPQNQAEGMLGSLIKIVAEKVTITDSKLSCVSADVSKMAEAIDTLSTKLVDLIQSSKSTAPSHRSAPSSFQNDSGEHGITADWLITLPGGQEVHALKGDSALKVMQKLGADNKKKCPERLALCALIGQAAVILFQKDLSRGEKVSFVHKANLAKLCDLTQAVGWGD
jgi:hypothetical protein